MLNALVCGVWRRHCARVQPQIDTLDTYMYLDKYENDFRIENPDCGLGSRQQGEGDRCPISFAGGGVRCYE